MLLCVSDGNIKSLLHKMRSCTLVRTIYKNTTIWKPIWIGFRLVPKTLWRLKASSTIISMRWFQSEILYCLQISVGCEGHSIALFLQEANKSDEATWKNWKDKNFLTQRHIQDDSCWCCLHKHFHQDHIQPSLSHVPFVRNEIPSILNL